ncbi:MAG: hypothetical protein WDN03_06925 [Rhizomicrobium sp.]
MPFVLDNGGSYGLVRDASTWTDRHPGWRRSVGGVGEANYLMNGGEAGAAVVKLRDAALGPLRLDELGVVETKAGGPLGGLVSDLFWDRIYAPKAGEAVEGAIGGNVLKSFRFTVDYPNRTSYWLQQAPLDIRDLDQVGITLVRAKGTTAIAGVAEKNGKPTVEGVAAGDILLKIDDLAAAGSTRGQLLAALHGVPCTAKHLTLERDGRQFNRRRAGDGILTVRGAFGVDDGGRRSLVAAGDLDRRLQVTGQRLDDAGTQAGGARRLRGGAADAVVAHRQAPVGALRGEVDFDMALAAVRKAVLERVDHQFGDDQPEADGVVRLDLAAGRRGQDRHRLVAFGHRIRQPGAQLLQIGTERTERDLAQHAGGRQLALHRGDQDQALVHVAQVHARLFRLDGAGLEQQDAGDDLQAVGDAVMRFLLQDVLLLGQLLLEMFGAAQVGHVLQSDQDGGFGILRVEGPVRVQQHPVHAALRHLHLDFDVLCHEIAGDDFGQGLQRDIAPARHRRFAERPARRGVECAGKQVVIGAARHHDAEAAIQDRHRLARHRHHGLGERFALLERRRQPCRQAGCAERTFLMFQLIFLAHIATSVPRVR